jgi:hypothetical protein
MVAVFVVVILVFSGGGVTTVALFCFRFCLFWFAFAQF